MEDWPSAPSMLLELSNLVTSFRYYEYYTIENGNAIPKMKKFETEKPTCFLGNEIPSRFLGVFESEK